MVALLDTLFTLTGYRFTEQIYSGSKTIVCRGIREQDQKSVIIKLMRNEYPTFNEIAQFRNQYTISKNLNLTGIVKPYSLETYRNGYALILEDFGGISLKDALLFKSEERKNPNFIDQFFHIAIEITSILEGMHRYRVIHKDIKPANILINPSTLEVKLIDFSIASLFLTNPNVLEKTLAYISPEQTGRMNRGKVLFDFLQASGFRVLVAKNGESALEKLQAVSPDLILLDVMMPGIDGFETCDRLKASPATQEIPVIFMTALSDAVDKVKGLSLGAVDYITKPFQQEEVLARVNLHLKLHHLNKQLEQRVAERTAELTFALEKLQQSQLQLVQTEKMSALGQLVAGVAHEINNPAGFIKGNLIHSHEYVQDLIHHIYLYQKRVSEAEIAQHAEEIDLEYLLEDLPKTLASMQQGVERICDISVSLRTFFRADSNAKVPFNIHDGIDSTILILKHRLKASDEHPAIEVVRNYGNLPLIKCFPGQLNQVFMNLIANAIDPLEESNIGRSFSDIKANANQIIIQTTLIDKNYILIQIKDNGVGMSDEVKKKVFDNLFTTKPVGQGTGLGLAIARQIVVEKHGGTLEVKSSPTEGAEFAITIPVPDKN